MSKGKGFMSVRMTIETASKAEAELLAQQLPVDARAQSWRGLGVKDKVEARMLIEAVSRSFHQHGLRWARVRYDDEERVFKANGHQPG